MTSKSESYIELTDDQHCQFRVTRTEMQALVQQYLTKTGSEDVKRVEDIYGGLDGLLEELQTSAKHGIASASLDARERAFGSHFKAPPKRTPFYRFFIAALDDLMLKILMACALFSIVVDTAFAKSGEKELAWVEGAAILVAVAVVSSVSAWSDY